MSMEYTFRPIEQWPGKLKSNRKNSTFKAAHSSTMRLLDRELSHLGARKVVIQLALSERDIRLDGRPLADSRPNHPGVIISFEKPGERYWDKAANNYRERPATALNFPCDTYASWKENMRAIALALEALRRVDRYGVTQNQEQYRGWARLPPPAIVTPQMTPNDAAAFFEKHCPYTRISILSDSGTFKTAYQTAAKQLHPDTNSGSHLPEWGMLQAARAVLRAHHGIL